MMKQIGIKLIQIKMGDSFATFQESTGRFVEFPVYQTQSGLTIEPVEMITLSHKQKRRVIWEIPNEIKNSAPFSLVEVDMENERLVSKSWYQDGLAWCLKKAAYNEQISAWGESEIVI